MVHSTRDDFDSSLWLEVNKNYRLLLVFEFYYDESGFEAAADMWGHYKILLIMAHLEIFPEREAHLLAHDPLESEQLIGELEDEIDDLNRLIYLKDKALEKIKQAVCCSPEEKLAVYNKANGANKS